ncbi:glycerol acyltransferase [Aerococcaceae bacterium DSM 111020]|nr:glycerol acyltransferase [Aerococcaceae bacterium DSM 111020]
MNSNKHPMWSRATLFNYGFFFLSIRFIVRKFSRSYRFLEDTLPESIEPTVFVSHHENLKGPIRLLLWLPFFVRTWIFSSIVDQEDCYHHYVNFTFTKRFKMPKKIAKQLAKPASHIVAWGMHSLQAIPVFRSSRKIVKTFDITIETLKKNQPVLILPDVDYASTTTHVGKIYEGFFNIDRAYYKETGQRVRFLPVYASQDTFQIRCGEPIYFKGDKHFREERKEIAEQIHHEMNRIILMESKTS